MPGDEATSYLVRHAKAGSRERWTAPDRDRPLTDAGKDPGHRAGRALLGPARSRVLSSPYLRCVETVAPLAEALGLSVEEDDRLAEGADPGLGDGHGSPPLRDRCCAPTATSWRRS